MMGMIACLLWRFFSAIPARLSVSPDNLTACVGIFQQCPCLQKKAPALFFFGSGWQKNAPIFQRA
jgi:hypothetical protein